MDTFYVDGVVAARERRHIDQTRRERIFKIQMLRKRNKEEADLKRAKERKPHQSQLLEEANANVEKEQAELLNIGKETWVDCGTPESLLAASIMAKEGKLNPNPFK